MRVLSLPQQVGEGERFEGSGPGGAGVPEGVRVPRFPPTPHRAQRARAVMPRRVDAVHTNHRGAFRGQRSIGTSQSQKISGREDEERRPISKKVWNIGEKLLLFLWNPTRCRYLTSQRVSNGLLCVELKCGVQRLGVKVGQRIDRGLTDALWIPLDSLCIKASGSWSCSSAGTQRTRRTLCERFNRLLIDP